MVMALLALIFSIASPNWSAGQTKISKQLFETQFVVLATKYQQQWLAINRQNPSHQSQSQSRARLRQIDIVNPVNISGLPAVITVRLGTSGQLIVLAQVESTCQLEYELGAQVQVRGHCPF